MREKGWLGFGVEAVAVSELSRSNEGEQTSRILHRCPEKKGQERRCKIHALVDKSGRMRPKTQRRPILGPPGNRSPCDRSQCDIS